MNLNKVFLIGRLTQEVDFRFLPSGTPMAILNLATNRIYKDKTGNLKEETEYHRVVAWGKLAEVCHQNLNKGRLIFVEGRIRSRSWIDAQGNKRVTYEIIAENIKFGPKPGSDVIEKNLEELEAELEDYKLETPEEFGILDIPF
ncbi:MAG: single-stranded DNA-binding protein [Candidatus Aenigmatarchaeota archaeon]|jgi:single-strand DNA-binding protein